jgi:VanZ family protein
MAYAAPLLILLGIAVWSIAPFPIPDFPGALGGVPHAVAYGALVWTTLNVPGAFSDARDRPRWLRILALILLAAVVGAGVEFGQAIVHRDAEMADVLADVVGIAVAVLMWLFASRRRLGRPVAR